MKRGGAQLGLRWNSNDDPLSSLLLLVVCTRCATQDYYAQVWRLDLHERCECMLDSVVQMYVGHQMLSTEDRAVQSPKVSNFGSELMKRWG